eukprot:TRINITY_DN1388_c0_g1_i1.p2 TRINITY_DN1388_c0_g1~~TRINITY_DN1388_c0_g1_i1.p2  ORF type:complete len:204 (+),score=4.94 TRINITY_DN1388_c0_g1_i1:46-612(+)
MFNRFANTFAKKCLYRNCMSLLVKLPANKFSRLCCVIYYQRMHQINMDLNCVFQSNHVYKNLGQQRLYSEDLRTEISQISEGEFHKQADQVMDDLQERVEVLIDDSNIEGADVEYSQGVLTVKLGKFGTYVINKQTPNRQIWMSSPISGPFRYDCDGGRWIYHRDQHDMIKKIEKEFSSIFQEDVQLE